MKMMMDVVREMPLEAKGEDQGLQQYQKHLGLLRVIVTYLQVNFPDVIYIFHVIFVSSQKI